VNGASLATVICHLITVTIDFVILKKIINLKLKFSTFILKPILATVMMIICALFTYNKLIYIFAEKTSLILTLGLVVLIYSILIIFLKIFDKNNLYMIPFNNKIFKIIKHETQ
jgi:hypothetical protein